MTRQSSRVQLAVGLAIAVTTAGGAYLVWVIHSRRRFCPPQAELSAFIVPPCVHYVVYRSHDGVVFPARNLGDCDVPQRLDLPRLSLVALFAGSQSSKVAEPE